jgi:predicted nucleotidyltransferase
MAVNEKVLAHLEAISRTYGVVILHAVETGSRAQGLATDHSDHDIGFIYVRRPEAYFRTNAGHRDSSLQENRDTLEVKVDGFGDFNGWDIEKAVTKAYSSNPTLVDWLRLPEYYSDEHIEPLRELMWKGFSTLKLRQMNVSLVRKNYNTFIQDRSHPQVKKYIQTVRPLLNALWFDRTAKMNLGTDMPPYLYTQLCNVAAYDHDFLEGCIQLRLLKMQGEERVPRIYGIDRIIAQLLETREIPEGLTRVAPDIHEFDRYFAHVVLNRGGNA